MESRLKRTECAHNAYPAQDAHAVMCCMKQWVHMHAAACYIWNCIGARQEAGCLLACPCCRSACSLLAEFVPHSMWYARCWAACEVTSKSVCYRWLQRTACNRMACFDSSVLVVTHMLTLTCLLCMHADAPGLCQPCAQRRTTGQAAGMRMHPMQTAKPCTHAWKFLPISKR